MEGRQRSLDLESLPRWDLSRFYPGFASREYAEAKLSLSLLSDRLPAHVGARPSSSVEAKLVMLFEPDSANHASLYASVRRLCGAPVIGCTTGGAGFTERGVTESGIVGTFLGGDDLLRLRVGIRRPAGERRARSPVR